MPFSNLHVHASEDLPLLAAQLLEQRMRQVLADREWAHVALSGGTTPQALFRLLATEDWRRRLRWERIHLWWVDERCVPPVDPDSNYGTAHDLLLKFIPQAHVHRMLGEHPPPYAAAATYEQEMRGVQGLIQGDLPTLDFVLLGMGDDGHTASLFPKTRALEERQAWVTVGQAPTPPKERLTLTLPVLNHAAMVLFLVSGERKGPALKQVFSHGDQRRPLPAALVKPDPGELLWLVDESARRAAGL